MIKSVLTYEQLERLGFQADENAYLRWEELPERMYFSEEHSVAEIEATRADGTNLYEITSVRDAYGEYHEYPISHPRFRKAQSINDLYSMISNPRYDAREIRREKLGRPLYTDNPVLIEKGTKVLEELFKE